MSTKQLQGITHAAKKQKKSKAMIQAESILSVQQIADLQEAFKLFDRDGDGTISTDELTIVLRSIGQNPTQREIEAMIAEVEVNVKTVDKANKELEFDEFLLLMSKKIKEGELEEDMKEAFKTFDTKNKGHFNIT